MRNRRVLLMPLAAVLAAALWVSFGTFSTATGQESPVLIDRAHAGARAPTFDKPIFVLVLGGDARSGNPVNQRFDSIHILSVVPGDKPTASILGIPRDTYVEVPGRGRRKINDAGVFGGADLMTRTIENLTACTFDYYMQVAFDGFRGPRKGRGPSVINDIGGIHLDVEKDYSERIPVRLKKGYQRLNGNRALAYARNRHERPGGDFDRSLAQGRLMVAALRELRSDVRRTPGAALRALGALRRHLRLNIGLTESFELGLLSLRINPRDVENEVMDGVNSSAGGASVVRATSRARRQFADICSDGRLNG